MVKKIPTKAKKKLAVLITVVALFNLLLFYFLINSEVIPNGYSDCNQYVQICDYTNIKIEKKEITVTEKMIKSEIEYDLREYLQENDVTTRKSRTGDIIYFVCSGYNKTTGNVIEEVEGCIELGLQTYGTEFDNMLECKNVGESFKAIVNMPEFSDWYAGECLLLDISIKRITEMVLPLIDDSFVKKNLNYSSYEEYRKHIEEQTKQINETVYLNEQKSKMINSIVNKSHFKNVKNSSLYKKRFEEIKANIDLQCKTYGLSEAEVLLTMYGENISIQDYVYEMVKDELVIGTIAIKEKLFLSRLEYYKAAKTFVKKEGNQSIIEYTHLTSKEFLRRTLLEERVMDYLYNTVQ